MSDSTAEDALKELRELRATFAGTPDDLYAFDLALDATYAGRGAKLLKILDFLDGHLPGRDRGQLMTHALVAGAMLALGVGPEDDPVTILDRMLSDAPPPKSVVLN